MKISHYENFPVASVLCPPRLRPAVLAIYRYARTADDLADEGPASPAARLSALADYGHALDQAVLGRPTTQWREIFDPLSVAINAHTLPVALLRDLLSAFAQDCTNPIYDDRPQLLEYCRRSANPIGRLLLHLYGVQEPDALSQSDAICTALQLTNFWQDPSIDLARGRNYFPLQDLRRHGLGHRDLQSGVDSPSTQAVVADLSAWAGALMREGSPLADRLPGRVGWEMRLVVQGGLRILRRIEDMNFRTLSARPRLHAFDWIAVFWHALRMAPAARAETGARA